MTNRMPSGGKGGTAAAISAEQRFLGWAVTLLGGALMATGGAAMLLAGF